MVERRPRYRQYPFRGYLTSDRSCIFLLVTRWLSAGAAKPEESAVSLVEHEVITETEQRARTLEAAALEIEVRGWHQGRLCGADGTVCIAGAIAASLGFEPSDLIAFDVAHTVWFGQETEATMELLRLPLWNDEEGRTAEEVTARLRSRAAELRSI